MFEEQVQVQSLSTLARFPILKPYPAVVNRLVVTLNADNLGKVKVDLAKQGSLLTARLHCSDPAAGMVLWAGIRQLDDQLLEMGIYPSQIEIINGDKRRVAAARGGSKTAGGEKMARGIGPKSGSQDL